MRAAWYERGGPASEVLTVGEMDAPRPGPREVLVRVWVSGVNPGEVKKRTEWMGFGIGYPRLIPHSDGAGTEESMQALRGETPPGGSLGIVTDHEELFDVVEEF